MYGMEDHVPQPPFARALFDESDNADETAATANDTANATLAPPSAVQGRDWCGYYARLGVATSATPQQLRRAFLELSQRYHTDKHVSEGAEVQARMSERFKELQEAYTVLMDERQRAAYDAAGQRGAKYLALIPAADAVGEMSRERIVQYIQYLEQSRRLRTMASMLAFRSQLRLQYNLAVLQSLPAMLDRLHRAAQAERPATAADDVAPPPPAAAAAAVAVTQQGTEAGGNEHKADRETTPSDITAGNHEQESTATTAGDDSSEDTVKTPAMQANPADFAAMEVVINGERQFVLLPPPAMQRKIRESLAAAAARAKSGGNEDDAPHMGSAALADRAARRGAASQAFALEARRALALISAALLPRSVGAEYGFGHVFSPRLAARVQVWGRTSGPKPMGVLTTLRRVTSGAASYTLKLRTTMTEMKATAQLDRALSQVWQMQAALVLFKSLAPLTKLKLSLRRALSKYTLLTSTLAMSWLTRGSFRTVLAHSHDGRDCTLMLNMSQDAVTLALQIQLSRLYGVQISTPATRLAEQGQAAAELDDGEEWQSTAAANNKDNNNNNTAALRPRVARGAESLSVYTASALGLTTVQYEMWYHHAALQHYGLGFSTSLPAAFSPMAGAYGVAWGERPWVINGISLLYRRGQNSIAIPVTLAVTQRWTRAATWMLLPMVTYRAATLLYRHYSLQAVARYYVAERRAHVAEVDVCCARALQEQKALEDVVLRARAEEEAIGGLVVVNARYGVLQPQYVDDTPPPPCEHTKRGGWARWRRLRGVLAAACARRAKDVYGRAHDAWRRLRPAAQAADGVDSVALPQPCQADTITDADIDLVLDVTVALQNLVHDSTLTLPAGTKASLVGFCDPDPYTAERKQLKIVYRFEHKFHQVIVEDEDEVQLPRREHCAER